MLDKTIRALDTGGQRYWPLDRLYDIGHGDGRRRPGQL